VEEAAHATCSAGSGPAALGRRGWRALLRESASDFQSGLPAEGEALTWAEAVGVPEHAVRAWLTHQSARSMISFVSIGQAHGLVHARG
jgi:hypothetical protein